MGNHQSKNQGSSSQSQSDPANTGYGASSASHSSSLRPRPSDQTQGPPDRSRDRPRGINAIVRGTVGSKSDPSSPEARKETKAEKDARKLEKERAARKKEREVSTREEGVDGGYLVTLGTYTGTEDWDKLVVRRLMIERRLAPFWRGLETHEPSWQWNQIIAAARGQVVPPPEPNLPQARPMIDTSPKSSASNVNALSVPRASRESSFNSESSSLSPSHPAFASQSLPFGSPSPLFRARAKTLASLGSGSRNSSQSDTTPQEVQLPADPFVNGEHIEIVLYKDPQECPICFLYYPNYLNKTRCCDQPICSECFVQIKRPDPHPPEHHGSGDRPEGDPHQEDPLMEQSSGSLPNPENMLVSEPATCPFCKQPELGITYDPPPFRRGLTYTNAGGHPLASVTSAMSSSSSINSQGPSGHLRRRTVSLGANSPLVVTTDRIRPDWAKKLSDARAYALRRAAAATALHSAAYLFNNGADNNGRIQLAQFRSRIARREPPGNSSSLSNFAAIIAAADRQLAASNGLGRVPPRESSRSRQVGAIEELMVAEAIRISIAEEEDRRRKEEKEAKAAKKDEERKRKEEEKAAKKAAKASRKSMLYPLTWNSSSTSHLATGESSTQTGKGKSVDRSYDDSSSVPTSPKDNPQQHLEFSRTHIQSSHTAESSGHGTLPTEGLPIREPQPHRHALRKLSVASSSGSSITEPFHSHDGACASSSLEPSPNTSGLNLDGGGSAFRSETPPGDSLFNFRSLAAVIDVGSAADSKNGTTECVEEAPVNAVAVRQLITPEVTSPVLQGSGTSMAPSTAASTAASTPPIVEQVRQNAGESGIREQSKYGTTQMVVEAKGRVEESMQN